MASSTACRRLISSRSRAAVLEIEIGGGGAHALFEIGDGRLEIMADQRVGAAPAPASTVT